MTRAHYTPAVKRIADDVRKLTTGELLALRESLARTFDILPPDEPEPDVGVREPRRPRPPQFGAPGYLCREDE